MEGVQEIVLSQTTVRALSAFNFAVNRNATPDLSILQGWTAATTASKIAEALPAATEAQVAQYVEALSPAVSAAEKVFAAIAAEQAVHFEEVEPAATADEAEAAAAAAAAPEEAAAAAPAEEASAPCPIDVAGIVKKAVDSAETSPVAAASAAPTSSCPIDVAGIVKAAVARHSPPAPVQAASAAPSLPTRPAPSTGPGGLSALPQRTGPGPRPAGLTTPAGMGSSLSSSLNAGMAAAREAAASASAAASSAAASASSAISAATGAPPVLEDDPNEPKEIKDLRKKVQDIRIMLFRLAKRLDQNLRGSIINQVEYRLSLAERIKLTNPRTAGQRRPSAFEAARQKAEELEAEDPNGDLDFKCTVMLLGMTGVGKSATINSLMGEGAVPVSAFDTETKKVRVVTGMVHGVKMKFIDTPGLSPSASATGRNQRILSQAKGAFKRHKPDIVLYLDRMDNVRRSFGDLPLLRSITDMFGASMWFNTIVVLTHASTAPPEGPNGPISYDVYTNHRSHILQQTIRQAAGDMRLLNPVTYAENHPNCRTNQEGNPVLPNGVQWKQNLLLYIFSSKILSSTESVLKIQSSASAAQMMNPGSQKIPPLPYLLSNMIQTKVPRKAPDEEREIMSPEEIEKLNDEDRKTQIRKRREYEKMRAEEAKADADNKTQVSVPAPDPALQPTFDSDSNGHRYRFLEAAGGWVVRPFVEAHGVDHDDGVEGFSCERGSMLRKKGQYLGGVPANAMFQLQKDKTNFSVNGEAEASCNHTRNVVSTGTLEVQTIGGRDMVYTSKLETRIRNHPKNKTAAGICMSRLAENNLPLKGPVAVGFKAEDKLKVMQGVKAIISAGMMSTKTRVGRETAKAANAELRLKGGPNMERQLTVGGSLMHWRRDLLLGGNVSSQYGITDETTVTTRANLNSKATGSLQVRVTSHDHPVLGVSLLVPLCGFLYDKIFRGEVY